MDEVVGTGEMHRNSTRTRALHKLEGGHICVRTLEVGCVQTKVKGEEIDVDIMRFVCSPTYKENDYTVCLVFRKARNRKDAKFLPDHSSCNCPDDGCRLCR